MTQELQDYLTRQLDAAATPEEVSRAMVSAMKALIDCQRKTAARVKELCAEDERKRNRMEGAKIFGQILSIAAASGGGALVLRLIQAVHL